MWLYFTLFLSSFCLSSYIECIERPICKSPGSSITDYATTSSSILIPDDLFEETYFSGKITDLQILVQIAHTWTSDLSINIEHSSQSVVLFDSTYSSTDSINAVFTDKTKKQLDSSSIDCNCNIRAQNNASLLEVYYDTVPTGNWTLSIQDNIAGDTGTLNKWCINKLCYDYRSVAYNHSEYCYNDTVQNNNNNMECSYGKLVGDSEALSMCTLKHNSGMGTYTHGPNLYCSRNITKYSVIFNTEHYSCESPMINLDLYGIDFSTTVPALEIKVTGDSKLTKDCSEVHCLHGYKLDGVLLDIRDELEITVDTNMTNTKTNVEYDVKIICNATDKSLYNNILVYAPTVTRSMAYYRQRLANVLPHYNFTIVDDTKWKTLKKADFQQFKAIMFGENACEYNHYAPWGTGSSGPESNNDIWVPLITGNILLSTLDDAYHGIYYVNTYSMKLTEVMLEYIVASDGMGLLLATSCYYYTYYINMLQSEFNSYFTAYSHYSYNLDYNAQWSSDPILGKLTKDLFSNMHAHRYFSTYSTEFSVVATNDYGYPIIVVRSGADYTRSPTTVTVSPTNMPTQKPTNFSATWNLEHKILNHTENYDSLDLYNNTVYHKYSFVINDTRYIMVKDIMTIKVINSKCKEPIISVYIAGTDYNSYSEYIENITINNVGFGKCDPGYDYNCVPDYLCIAGYKLKNDLDVNDVLKIEFFPSYGIINAFGCGNSFIGKVDVRCLSSKTYHPTSLSNNPTHKPSSYPTTCYSCHYFYWSYNNTLTAKKEKDVVHNYTLRDTRYSMYKDELVVTILESDCVNPQFTIKLAATDFVSSYDYLDRIVIDGVNAGSCDPGRTLYSGDCKPDYTCLSNYQLNHNLRKDHPFYIEFHAYNYLYYNSHCNYYSLYAFIELKCEGTRAPSKAPTLTPTVRWDNPFGFNISVDIFTIVKTINNNKTAIEKVFREGFEYESKLYESPHQFRNKIVGLLTQYPENDKVRNMLMKVTCYSKTVCDSLHEIAGSDTFRMYIQNNLENELRDPNLVVEQLRLTDDHDESKSPTKSPTRNLSPTTITSTPTKLPTPLWFDPYTFNVSVEVTSKYSNDDIYNYKQKQILDAFVAGYESQTPYESPHQFRLDFFVYVKPINHRVLLVNYSYTTFKIIVSTHTKKVKNILLDLSDTQDFEFIIQDNLETNLNDKSLVINTFKPENDDSTIHDDDTTTTNRPTMRPSTMRPSTMRPSSIANSPTTTNNTQSKQHNSNNSSGIGKTYMIIIITAAIILCVLLVLVIWCCKYRFQVNIVKTGDKERIPDEETDKDDEKEVQLSNIEGILGTGNRQIDVSAVVALNE